MFTNAPTNELYIFRTGLNEYNNLNGLQYPKRSTRCKIRLSSLIKCKK